MFKFVSGVDFIYRVLYFYFFNGLLVNNSLWNGGEGALDNVYLKYGKAPNV